MKTNKWIPGQKEPGTFDNLQVDAPTFLVIRGKTEPSQPLALALLRMVHLLSAGIPFDLYDSEQRLYHFDGTQVVGSTRVMSLMSDLQEELTRVVNLTAAQVRARTMQEAADQINRVLESKEKFSADTLKLQD
jgi:hypothetical protein